MGDKPIKVLLVEDNPGDARLIREMLKEAAAARFELVHVVRLDEALKLLGEASFDVLLLDLTLPDSQGLDTFFRVYSQAPDVPIVVLTGLADEVVGVESVKGGAQDYLVKGQVDSNLLARALRYAIERKQAEERLQESKRKYKTLFDNTIDGVFIIDAETMKIVLVNPAAAKMYGFDSLEGISSADSLDFIPPEDRERVIKIITEDLFENDVRQIREIRTITRDGREIWIEAFGIRTEYRGRLAGLVSIRDITKRKRAEEALRESERRYRLLAENVTDVIWTTDMNLRHTYVTPSITRLRGISVDEALAETPKKYLTPASFEIAMKVLQEELTIEKMEKKNLFRSRTLELEMTRKDGSTVWTENTMSFLRDPDGLPIGIVGVTRDITERKKAEETLRESERRYRLLAENVSDVITCVDMNLRPTYLSPSITRLLGYSIEEAMAATPEEYLTPASLEVALKALQKELAIDKMEKKNLFRSRTLELEMTRKDGSTVWTENTMSFLRDPDGRPIGIVGVIRDITERKRAEEALQESERRYRLLAENVTDVIYVMDMNLRPTYMSPSTTRLLGYSVEEAMSRSMEESLTPASLQAARQAFASALKTKEMGGEGSYPEGTLELEMKCKDGSTVWTESTVSFLRDPEGRPIGLLGVIRDITERKKMEDERKVLEQRAQIASRLASVGEMASGIAHEINNPLTSVIGFAQLLIQKDIPEDIGEDVKIINEGAQRVASIVKRLLTFAHQHKPERTYVNINDIIATTLDLRAYEIETSNIKVITQLDPDLPSTMADGGQLQQVFLNIIINAETEMKLAHGKGNLFIKTETMDNTIRISFKDDGPGIAKENLERIFEPFFTTREVGKGTGLGLSVCHGIVTEHGGRIYAESELGKGATFIVELPLVTMPEQLKLAEPVAGESKREDGASVLVVDDEPAILQFLSRVLTEEGHQVETVDNAGSALERLKSKRYNLILLDIKLPEMSGIELYKRIQKIAKSLARRVVFITGDVIGADTKDFLARTKALYITKPFDTEQLKKDINSILTHGVVEVSQSEIFLESLTSPKIES